MNIETVVQEARITEPMELPRRHPNERHFVITNENDLLELGGWAKKQNYYLCTLVATDERLHEERSFKLYYIFSEPEQGELIVVEIPVSDLDNPVYPSLREIFPSVIPLEKEIYDMFGLKPKGDSLELVDGFLLHIPPYHHTDEPLYPLRRRRPMRKLHEIIGNWTKSISKQKVDSMQMAEGMFILPVGPIHAGVIEPGHFPFHIAGEVIEELPLRLGYKHRGIEKLFETRYTLENGWELAEKASGDSSFAHSLSYCQAIESIAEVAPPEPALYWRGLFLELERIYNHMADVSALAHDMAYDRAASPIATLRETMVQLNQRLGGHRLLCSLNRPGGVQLPSSVEMFSTADQVIEAVTEEFLEWGKHLMEKPACRERMLTTGVLTYEEAKNATGLVARASGWLKQDFRLRHPQGAYKDSVVQEMLQETIVSEKEGYPNRQVPIYSQDLRGDVLSRMMVRVAEVETSANLVRYFIRRLQSCDPKEPTFVPIKEQLQSAPNREIGLGYVEGWRGDIVYFIMKGPGDTIFRCKVHDPSIFNWHVFPQAVVRKSKGENSEEYWENLLADFPLINKSFNLSYAGHDL
jgi:Ni,Fe-hydrogenase III large subunit/Ni,Fe-hydrogenase III component G